ncbi:CheR family methyltransferase [Ohtaekwangia koreensis]|uniref:protein-glutamate O-methyltransferase n=1 Tax=Ohtaekwangia koreensis TaxID=688867 RepID=A0A1T5LCA3_9BACT|nr:CheR family methyltransferase [Ohtaekwangia koreensis]SKC73038.1 chemotaxis protein methyltransferase CheR [Ohtaekwangia koreensis]
METSDPISILRMDDESFERLSQYVTTVYGIKLPPAKRSMLESRLNKKVKSLGLSTYRELLDLVFSKEGKHSELLNVIDLITTNKTDFLREPLHFKFLSDSFLPEYFRTYGSRTLKVWSAACSTGEEPYTIMMVLEEFKKTNPFFNYSVMASDISLRVIQSAHHGIYTLDKISAIPPEWKRDYFLRSKDRSSNLVRIKPALRNKITYQRINLMDQSYNAVSQDIIFCRNVLIYFDKVVQEKVIRKLTASLRPGGILFLGHSESIMNMNVPLKQINPTIYQVPYGIA